MEKNYEKQIFPEEGNILGTVKFKFPGKGEYSLAFNGRSSVKIQDIVNKVCLGKRIKIKLQKLIKDKLMSRVITIKDTYEMTNNLFVRVFNSEKQFIGFIHIKKRIIIMKKNEKVLIKVSPKNIFKAGIGLLAINEYRKGGFQAGLSVLIGGAILGWLFFDE